MKTLIQGGVVLTLGARTPNFVEADVLIEDGRVAEIGRGLRARDAEVVEAAGTIVMPGLVDTHRHTWRTLFRGAEAGAAAPDRYGPHHAPDDVYAATLIGLLGAVASGITTVVDCSDVQRDERFTEAVLQAHADAGLRTVLVHAVPAWGEPATAVAAVRRLAAERGALADPLTTIAFGSADPVRTDLDRIARDWTEARTSGLRIHAHAGAAPEQRGVVADLAGRGLLGADVTLAHCSHLGDDDLDAIASHGVGVALAPATEMSSGLGAPPLQRLIDRGIRPGLGVADERFAPGDLFTQMQAAQSIQHAAVFDLKLAGKVGPDLLGTRDVIRYATADGARVAGLGELTGSLEVGKRADVLVLRADRPNIFPVNDPIGAVVWGMNPSNVDWVFVDGRPLVRNGVLEADVERARGLAVAARERVTAAGHLVETTDGGGR